MKFIVTVGTGFIGSNLVSHLLFFADYDVSVIDYLTYAADSSFL